MVDLEKRNEIEKMIIGKKYYLVEKFANIHLPQLRECILLGKTNRYFIFKKIKGGYIECVCTHSLRNEFIIKDIK